MRLLPTDAQTSGIVRIAPIDGSDRLPRGCGAVVQPHRHGHVRPGHSSAVGREGRDRTRSHAPGAHRDVERGHRAHQPRFRQPLRDPGRELRGVLLRREVETYSTHRERIASRSRTACTWPPGPGTRTSWRTGSRTRSRSRCPQTCEAITAEIRVTDGGPGFAYATVIDNKTGDPNFIPAQLTP